MFSPSPVSPSPLPSPESSWISHWGSLLTPLTHPLTPDSLLDVTIAKTVPCPETLPAMHCHIWILAILSFLIVLSEFHVSPFCLCGFKAKIYISFVGTWGLENDESRRWESDEESPYVTMRKGRLRWLWEMEGLETNPELPGWLSCPLCLPLLFFDLKWLILCHWVETREK